MTERLLKELTILILCVSNSNFGTYIILMKVHFELFSASILYQTSLLEFIWQQSIFMFLSFCAVGYVIFAQSSMDILCKKISSRIHLVVVLICMNKIRYLVSSQLYLYIPLFPSKQLDCCFKLSCVYPMLKISTIRW